MKIKTACGLEKYEELKKELVFCKASPVMVVIFASIRDTLK